MSNNSAQESVGQMADRLERLSVLLESLNDKLDDIMELELSYRRMKDELLEEDDNNGSYEFCYMINRINRLIDGKKGQMELLNEEINAVQGEMYELKKRIYP